MDGHGQPGRRELRRPDADRQPLTPAHRQLASELSLGPGPSGLALSASKELEFGTRAALLVAEGLFRLDVVVEGDTLRTVVRNLSSGPLRMSGRPAEDSTGSVVIGEAAAYEPAQTNLRFELGSGQDRVEVTVLMGILHFADRGTVRVTAQAIVRPGQPS